MSDFTRTAASVLPQAALCAGGVSGAPARLGAGHGEVPVTEGRDLVPSNSGAQIPLAQVFTIKSVLGPQEIKAEHGLLVGYVTMNTHNRDEVSVVEDAEAARAQPAVDSLTSP